jgi:rubredoxin
MTGQETAESAAAFDTAAAIATPARVPGYRAAHTRVQAARGHATAYRCEGCGGPAVDWAYRHDDPAELVDVVNGKPRHYSLDSDRYAPLCRPCHRRLDHAHRVFASW